MLPVERGIVDCRILFDFLLLLQKSISMENHEKHFKLGMITVLTAVKKTLSMYPNGMTSKQVDDMLDEVDQQLGIKQTEIQLLKRA